VHSLPLTPKRKQKEWTIIQYIAQTNNFPHTLIQKLNSQLQHGHSNYDRKNNTDRDINTWITFTYYSPLVRKITNLFKHTSVGTSFVSTNTIQHLTKPKATNYIQERKICGTYKLTCNKCKLLYVGQTSLNLQQRCQEHIRYIKQNDPQSAYTLRIVNNYHGY